MHVLLGGMLLIVDSLVDKVDRLVDLLLDCLSLIGYYHC